MADNPAISSLQLLTIVYYNNCYFVATKRLQERRSSITYPETTFSIALGGGGGRKLGALVQTSIKQPSFFFAELRCKRGGGGV